MTSEQPRDIEADRPDDDPDRRDDTTDDQTDELRVVELGVDGQGVVDDDD